MLACYRIIGGVILSSHVYAEGIESARFNLTVQGVEFIRVYIFGNQGSVLGGVNKEDAINAFKETGLTWGPDFGNNDKEVYSVVYVASPYNVNGGRIYVDPQRQDAVGLAEVPPASVTLKRGSILMVNGDAVDNTETGNGEIAIRGVAQEDTQDSKLFVLNAKKGHDYFILDNPLAEFHSMFTNNKFLKLEKNDEFSDAFVVKAKVDNTQTTPLQESALKNIASGLNDSEGPAADFLLSLGTNTDDAAIQNAVNSLANFSELAGSTHGTYTTALLTSDLAQDHLSIAHHTKVMKKDLWAVYSHSNESVDGLTLTKQKADYEGSYHSYVIGSDLYEKDNFVLGVAGSYSTGKISSRHNAVSTKNKAKYYGASIYGRKINGKTSYLADLSYLHGSNDITQRNTGEVITGKPKTNAISLGIKAEQEFTTAHGSFIPTAGVRYMHLSQGDYKTSAGFSYEQDDQNLFLIPMGVKFTTERKAGDWHVKPMAEVGLVINTGDKDTKATISDGTNVDALDYTIVNGTSLVGKLGVQAERENLTLGVSYRYQKSSDTSDNRFQLNFGYKF